MSRRDTDSSDDDIIVSSRPFVADAKIALFIDFENIALGVRQASYAKFEINLLIERLVDKGKIVVKRAYCDWEKFPARSSSVGNV